MPPMRSSDAFDEIMAPKKAKTTTTKAKATPAPRGAKAKEVLAKSQAIASGKGIIATVDGAINKLDLDDDYNISLSREECEQLLAYVKSIAPVEMSPATLEHETNRLRDSLVRAIEKSLIWKPSAKNNGAKFSASIVTKYPDCFRMMLGLSETDTVQKSKAYPIKEFEDRIVEQEVRGSVRYDYLYE